MTKDFFLNESGMTQIEYGLVLSLVSIGISVVVIAMGDNLAANFDAIAGDLQEAAGQP